MAKTKTTCWYYRGADKFLVRAGRKEAGKHVRDARDFNNIETRDVIKFFFFLQGKAPKEIHAILIETLACFLPGRAKELSAPLYKPIIFKNENLDNNLSRKLSDMRSEFRDSVSQWLPFITWPWIVLSHISLISSRGHLCDKSRCYS